MRQFSKFVAVALILVLGGAVGGPGLAENIAYRSGGETLFSFDTPDGWRVFEGFEVSADEMPEGEVPAPRIISVQPPNESSVMWTGLWAPAHVTDLSEAKEHLQKLLPRFLANPVNLYSDRRTIGGKQARVYSGEGFRDGLDFDYAIGLIQIARDRIAIAAFLGEPDAYDRHEDALIGILASVSSGEVAK